MRPSPRWMKVIRDLRLHMGRTLLVVAAIVVGLAGAGSVLDTWALMRQVTRAQYRASRPPSATLRLAVSAAPGGAKAIDAALVAAVRALPSVAAVRGRTVASGSIRAPGNPTPRALVVYALDDFRLTSIGRVRGDGGAWPPPVGTLVLERSSVDFAGLAIGDTVTASLNDGGELRLPVAGIAQDVALAPGWMEHVVYAFADVRTLGMLGVAPQFDELQFLVRDSTLDRAGVRRVAGDVQRLLVARGVAVRSIEVPEPGRHVHAAQIDSLLFTQGAFGAITLLLSGVLVVNLVAAMLTGQVREIGVMKAIGATPQQVAMLYLALALVLGVIASLIAIPLAAVVGRAYADFTAQLLNFDTRGFAIPRWAFALQLAVGVVFPVAAAAIPVSHGCRVSVGEALRETGLSVRGSRDGASVTGGWLGTRMAGRVVFARPLLLSLRNAFRKRQRMALTLVTLAIGGAVYIGALNLRESVRGAVGLVFAAQRYDMVVRLTSTAATDSLEGVARRVDGVEIAEGWSAARAIVQHADGILGEPIPVSAVPPATSLLSQRVSAGRWLRTEDARALVINRRLQESEPSLRLGARASLTIAGRTEEWTVVGVTEAGLTPIAYAPHTTIASFIADGRSDRIAIRTSGRSPASQGDVMRRLRLALADAGIPVRDGQLMLEQHAVVEDHLLMVASFLGAMGVLMIVVGGLALASTMGLSVLERTREIGVLRAIGARHGTITTMVQLEGLVVSLLGWVLAIPLSLPMSVVLARAFGRIMLPLDVTWLPDPGGMLSWLVVAVTVSLVACAWPAGRATRITTKEALAYE